MWIESFLEALVQNVWLQKVDSQNEVEIYWPNLYFWSQTFCTRASRKRSVHLSTTSRYYNGSLRLRLCVSKNKYECTTGQSDSLAGKVKKVRILKN